MQFLVHRKLRLLTEAGPLDIGAPIGQPFAALVYGELFVVGDVVDFTTKSVKGGQIRVAFRIDTAGKLQDIHLRKSVEFILDEEGIGVMAKMPDWIPAEKDGIKRDAYRIQPVTFVKSK